MRNYLILVLFYLSFCSNISFGAEKTIGVFVALADNESQGIVKVPKAIGNGDDPEKNLYWGTAEGLKGVFDKSKDWSLKEKIDSPTDQDILRTRTYQHKNKKAALIAKAYKGSSIKKCIQDYESAIQLGSYDLVVFIGHNGLMDFELPKPVKAKNVTKISDCIVLCCKSDSYFKSRIEASGGKPILLTQQLMYPGSFILHAATDSWLDGKTITEIRESAGEAYALNQKISKKAGVGIFADLMK